MKVPVLALGLASALLAACSNGGDEGPAAVATPSAATEAPSPTTAPASPAAPTATTIAAEPVLRSFPVPAGSRPHDVAPALDGGVWYTAQGSGKLG